MKVIPISLKEANKFIEKYHRHNKKVVRDKFRIGLQKNGELIGVANAGRPVARLLDDGETIEVRRVCVKNGYKNACSMLYARIVKIAILMGYKKIITYTLTKESQSSLKAIGAKIEGRVRPGTWSRQNRQRKEQKVYLEPKIRWLLNPVRSERRET